MNDLLEGAGKPRDVPSERYTLPVIKEVLKYAAENSYIKHHGFRLAQGEGK